MKRSLLYLNSLLLSAALAFAGCAGASDSTETTADSIVAVTTDTPAMVPAVDSTPVPVAVTNPPEKTPEEKKEGKETRHSSENDRLLDSIKKAKAKDNTPPREIRHGSENDQLLDSIKQAKGRGKK